MDIDSLDHPPASPSMDIDSPGPSVNQLVYGDRLLVQLLASSSMEIDSLVHVSGSSSMEIDSLTHVSASSSMEIENTAHRPGRLW